MCFPALPGLPGICIFCQSLCWSLHEELHHTDWKTVWYPKLPDWCYRWQLRNGYALFFYWMQHVNIMVYINYRNLSNLLTTKHKYQVMLYLKQDKQTAELSCLAKTVAVHWFIPYSFLVIFNSSLQATCSSSPLWATLVPSSIVPDWLELVVWSWLWDPSL